MTDILPMHIETSPPARILAGCPLSLPGWVEYNQRKWGVKARRVLIQRAGRPLPAVEAVYYVNQRGKLVMPPLNPYLPVEFQPTATDSAIKAYSQWLAVGEALAVHWKAAGIAGTLIVHPQIADARPFQWQGLLTNVRYTFHLPFPADLSQADNDVRRRAKLAQDAGYSCAISANPQDVLACLAATEQRQHFRHRLDEADLNLALSLLGPEHLRLYVCYDPARQPVSAMLVLHCPGGWALDLAAGTLDAALGSGALQLVTSFALRDLAAAGAAGLDFAGAGIREIAAAKMQWGGRLTPFLTVEQYGLRSLARYLLAWRNAAAQRSAP